MVRTTCSKKVARCMFTTGECAVCSKSFSSSHSPANKLCNNCAKENEGLCEVCGKEIIEVNSNSIRKDIIDSKGGVRLTHVPSGIAFSHTGERLESWNERRCINQLLSSLVKMYCNDNQTILIRDKE